MILDADTYFHIMCFCFSCENVMHINMCETPTCCSTHSGQVWVSIKRFFISIEREEENVERKKCPQGL